MGLTGITWTTSLFVLIGLVQYATSLKCWQCTSNLSAGCGDPMNNTEHHGTFHIQDCDATSQHPYSYGRHLCRKIVRRVHGQREIIRQCTEPTPEERDITDGPCSQMAQPSYVTIESCNICSTDFCNSATSLSGKSFAFATVGALLSCYFSTSKLSLF
ncbi:uncharacterized protein LOC117181376 [Belonocnema kinseyi]|uniref:uncharacterized protein LOC117181376 n=1 Tax=Belonocnema kinseyi TaxID=2817044 RepID=UPI00143CD425|nr:uncharacterized protein LOC117181376 [Belonocnema kinseyi]